jgi:hypothetical protein
MEMAFQSCDHCMHFLKRKLNMILQNYTGNADGYLTYEVRVSIPIQQTACKPASTNFVDNKMKTGDLLFTLFS